MTATRRPPASIPAQRRRLRLSTMESLGFFEDTVTRTTSWTAVPIALADPVIAPVGPKDPFEGWTPSELGRRLVKGRIRWGLAVAVLIALAGVAGATAWLYQRPVEVAGQMLAELRVTAQTMESSLMAMRAASDEILPASSAATALVPSIVDVENRARDLFAASAALAGTQEPARLHAVDAAVEAMGASRMLGAALTFRSAAMPLLTVPPIQTDPQLIGLDEAAREFGEWQAQFDSVRLALPEGVFPAVSAELAVVSDYVDASQSSYLDAIRADDEAAAQAVLHALSERLSAVQSLLDGELADTKFRAVARIDDALGSIRLLLG